ncbi:MAG: diguanylate cyclase [Candidatus Omnitrophota bacterium]
MQNNLEETLRYFEILFEAVPNAVFVVDKDGRITRWNKRAEEITGYPSSEVIGRTCAMFTEGPCKTKCELFSGGIKNPIMAKECAIKRKDGQARVILKNADLLKDDKGNIIGGIESFEDITELKRAEERMREANSELELKAKNRTQEITRACQDLQNEIDKSKKTEESLARQERFLSSVFSSVQDGISILDKEMNIIRVNPAMEKWYAHAMPLIGKKCYEAYQCRSSHCQTCPAIRSLDTGGAVYDIVPKIGPEGKTTGWLDLYTFPLYDHETGEIKGVIEYVRDITERKKAEEEREKLNEELLRSNKRFKQLSLRDPHTGLYNHRYLQDVIEAEFHRARRYAHPLTVIMLDIDYFKSINDVYSHQFGDLVLKQFARQLKMMLRKYDIIIRLGGEEFIVISPGASRVQGVDLAQRLLDALSMYNFGDKEHTVKLKLSFAVSSYPEDQAIKGMDLINFADELMNKAKESGGNRVYSSADTKKQTSAAAAEKAREGADIGLLKAKIDKLTKSTNQSLVESISAFAKAIELKDHYTGEHVEMTVKYAKDIARKLGLPPIEIEQIGQAAILHDLGKIGISENILLKKMKLTKKEFEEIKKHPQIGADILRPVQFLHNLIPFIFYHHEKWNGKGYPSGIKGEEIPLGARIIAIADVYQALTSDRPYRKAYSKQEAVKILKDCSGSQFDPNIVDVFLKILQEEKPASRSRR